MNVTVEDRLARVPRLLADLRERTAVWRGTQYLGMVRIEDRLLDEAIATIEQLAAALRHDNKETRCTDD